MHKCYNHKPTSISISHNVVVILRNLYSILLFIPDEEIKYFNPKKKKKKKKKKYNITKNLKNEVCFLVRKLRLDGGSHFCHVKHKTQSHKGFGLWGGGFSVLTHSQSQHFVKTEQMASRVAREQEVSSNQNCKTLEEPKWQMKAGGGGPAPMRPHI